MLELLSEIIYFTKFPRKQKNIWLDRFLNYHKYKLYKNTLDNFSFPKVVSPKVSIIIPVYNNYQHTINCLYSILKRTNRIDYEVIIADDCSTDKTSKIQETIKNIRYIKTESNCGFLKNCNNAVKHARGEYIWLLNNDTQIVEDALSWMLKTFEKKKDAGIVGSKLIFANKMLQEAGGIIYQDATGYNYGRCQIPNSKEFNYLKEVDYCSGASLLIKKDFWQELGGFDEYFAPAYYEETDLCFRVREKGLKVYYQPKSEIIHFESVSLKESHDDLMKINGEKFFSRWKEVLKKQTQNPEYNFLARDRSQNKKTLLFCDDHILRPDTNCGNRSSFQYLEMFCEMGFNVKYIGKHYLKPDTPRDLVYEDMIQQLGVEMIDFTPGRFDRWFENNGKFVDYLYINRPQVWECLEPFFKKYCKSAKRFYQGHDVHFLRERRAHELAGDLEENSGWINDTEKAEKKIWKEADYVYYFSDKEIEIVKEYAPDSNAKKIPLYLYKEPEKIHYKDSRKDLLFVGSFRHTPNYDGVKWFIEEIFPLILSKNPEIKFNIVGANAPEDVLKYASDNIIFKGFVSDEELDELYKNTRIVVSPLRFGAGVKGKIIEAMMYQVPVVTTMIGIEGIDNEQRLIAVEDEVNKFAQKTVELYNNYEKLKQISEASLDYINQNFSMEKAKKEFEELLWQKITK